MDREIKCLNLMESNNSIQLTDKSVYPDEAVLTGVLGEVYPSYRALLDLFDRHGMIYEWRYYMDGKAWLCKVQKKKKTIVWMSAWKGFIKQLFTFMKSIWTGFWKFLSAKRPGK
jgi:hypothetical protein